MYHDGVAPKDWLLVVAAIGHATLASLSFARGGKSALARPLALLCCAMFGWCFAGLAHHVTGASYWGWVDDAFTALSPPLALHVIVSFVGARRIHRRVLAASYLAFGAMALVALSALVLATPRAWLASRIAAAPHAGKSLRPRLERRRRPARNAGASRRDSRDSAPC